MKYAPLSRVAIFRYWARVFARPASHALLLVTVCSLTTLAAPQMSPAQIERAFQQVHGKMATLEDLIRKVEKSNEVAIARLELHQESGRSHAQYGTQIEAQAVVLQAHSLRLAELDAVFRFVAYAISAAIGLLAIIATVVISLHKGHKKVVSEHHTMCEILQRMDARIQGRAKPFPSAGR